MSDDLPRSRGAMALTTRDSRTQVQPHILVIEDDLTAAKVLRLILEAEGCAVELACSRDLALGTLRRFPADLLLLDYRMSGLDAATFLSEARRAGFGGKVLLCTAWDREIALPVDGVVRKPFEVATLIEAVRALVGSFPD